MRYINKEFATWRGLVRTIISDIKWRTGVYKKYEQVDWSRVKRLVYICQGNICRSPFAKVIAASRSPHLPVASFGLATTTGVEADPTAIGAAQDYGIDLIEHRATNMADFSIAEGDLLVVMEDRHLHWLAPLVVNQDVQLCLLGLWCRPQFALLYDPFSHPKDYFLSCFSRIVRAVDSMLDEIDAYYST
ncbi:MAG: protein-tyrosine phosphatase [Motiliproteus sp.]|jgi:protein-tyrosine phosphatase